MDTPAHDNARPPERPLTAADRWLALAVSAAILLALLFGASA